MSTATNCRIRLCRQFVLTSDKVETASRGINVVKRAGDSRLSTKATKQLQKRDKVESRRSRQCVPVLIVICFQMIAVSEGQTDR